MGEREDDMALFERLRATHGAERAERLATAREEARERGKQTFDLAELERLYPGAPNSAQQPREEREREHEEAYYRSFPELMSVSEYAAKLSALDAGSDVLPPTGIVQRKARLGTLLRRVPPSFEHLSPAGRAQAQRDLREAAGHLDALLALLRTAKGGD